MKMNQRKRALTTSLTRLAGLKTKEARYHRNLSHLVGGPFCLGGVGSGTSLSSLLVSADDEDVEGVDELCEGSVEANTVVCRWALPSFRGACFFSARAKGCLFEARSRAGSAGLPLPAPTLGRPALTLVMALSLTMFL